MGLGRDPIQRHAGGLVKFGVISPFCLLIDNRRGWDGQPTFTSHGSRSKMPRTIWVGQPTIHDFPHGKYRQFHHTHHGVAYLKRGTLYDV